MVSNLYGNPHSACDPAKLSGDAVDSIREKALRFFKADPEHFDLVFTGNASAAIKLVGESFRDLATASSVSGAFWYGYHKDAHNSVVGVREFADGNQHCFVSDQEVEEWLNGYAVHINSSTDSALPGLFAYPGQSNMTGRRLPLAWTAQLRQSTKPQHQNTYSLLDAAALATTTQVDLSDPNTAPDFTTLSFYKIFGFPDLGALIIRKKSGHILSWRRYFGGGTVKGVTVLHEATFRRRSTSLHEGLEDGTLPFHSIVALGCALDVHKKLYGSMKAISRHTSFLGHRLYTRLSTLTHYNGRPACVIYNDILDPYPYTDPTNQGSTVAFNIVRADGSYIKYSLVEELANDKKIYLRAGGLCNPGGIASHLRIEPWQFKRAWSAGHICGEPVDTEIINGKPTGVVRASLGAMSIVRDIDAFIAFLSETFIEHPGMAVEVPQLELRHPTPLRHRVQNSRDDASSFSSTARVVPPQPRFPTHSKQPPQHQYQHSRDGSFDFEAEGPVVPPPHRVPLQPRENNNQGSAHDSRDDSSDFNSESRIALQPPQQQKRLQASTSTRSLKKEITPALRGKRSFFRRKSFDSNRGPNDMSPGMLSEMSGRTLTAEDAELQELIKQNLVLGAEANKSKANIKFWKGSGSKVGLI